MTDSADKDIAARDERSLTYVKHLGKKGDLTIELHAADFGDDRGKQNALQIYGPRKSAEPVTIPESEMWRFNEPRVLFLQGRKICDLLYGVISKSAVFNIIDALVEHIPDVLAAPPPPGKKADSLETILLKMQEAGLKFTWNDKVLVQ